MGRARDLTMGSRTRKPRIASTGDYAVVRRILASSTPDTAKLRAALDRIAASPHRLRFDEAVVRLKGCELLRHLTGEDYGPKWGTY
jgi:hypothetical protein